LLLFAGIVGGAVLKKSTDNENEEKNSVNVNHHFIISSVPEGRKK